MTALVLVAGIAAMVAGAAVVGGIAMLEGPENEKAGRGGSRPASRNVDARTV